MAKAYHRERILFRIVGLPIGLLQEIKDLLTDHNVETNLDMKSSRYNNPGHVVVDFELLSSYDYSEFHRFIRNNQLTENSYGIWVSLVTNWDNDGVHLPDYALKFYALIGGNIDFSFVYTGEPSSDEKQ